MLSWLLKKSFSKHLKKEIDPINKALEKSFNKIKEEFLHLHSKVDSRHANHDSIFQKLNHLEKRILNLETIKPTPETDEEETDSKPSASEWNSLTKLQQNMLKLMGKLHEEGAKRWISLKQLTEEIYPDREYDKVRPLISSYSSILIEYNLIKKKRVGKQLFLALTEKTFPYLDEYLRTKKLIKLIKNRG